MNKEQHELPDEPYTRPGSTRCGVIRIYRAVLCSVVSDIKIDDCDTNGFLRNSGVFETLHKRLLLPESYIIHAISIDRLFQTWNVLVESPDLPETKEFEEYPAIEPTYGHNGDGIVHLMKINVHTKVQSIVYPGLLKSI